MIIKLTWTNDDTPGLFCGHLTVDGGDEHGPAEIATIKANAEGRQYLFKAIVFLEGHSNGTPEEIQP